MSNKNTILEQLDWLLVNDVGTKLAIVDSGEFYNLTKGERSLLLQAVRATKVITQQGKEVSIN